MMKRFGLIIALLFGLATQARADNLGCFNASEVVHIWAQFANASGVATSPTSPSAKIFSPTDTTTASFTPTLAEIDAGGSPGLARGSFTLGASPTAGIWTVQYKGTIGGNVQTVVDVFQVPCPKMAIRVGGIPGGASPPDGVLSTISTTTLTLSTDVISAANQFAYQARIEVYNPTTYLQKGVSCIVASTTAAGPADTVTTAEDISATIATSDAFYLIPDPTCRNLRGTTAGNTFDVASTGEGGLDFANIKQATGVTTLTNITVPTVTTVTNPVDLTSAAQLAVLTAVSGTADSGSTSTIVDAERTEASADYWKDSCVLMTGGANIHQIRRVSAFNQSTDMITVDPVFTSAIGTGDTYRILRTGICTAANVAGNVTVGGYAAGQDPATLLLVTPANKIATNGSNQVVASSVQGNVTGSVASVTNPVTVGTNNDKAGYALTTANQLAILTAASGTADSGTTSTIVDAERTEAATDYWKDSCVLMTSGANINQLRRVSAFNATSDILTVDPAFTSAVGTDTYILLRSATCTAANVAGNVTVGGYAAGQDPATLLLVTPANKIATNASNQVVASSVQGNVTGSVGSVAGNVGGNVVGSVGSVTGAVGSVTGNVGGNVVGSVASVTNPVSANVTQLEGISLSGKVGDNFNAFFQNSGVDTTKEVEDVGTGAGGGGGGGIEMDQLVPGSPDSGSVGQALRFVLDRLDLNVSTRASQASIDSKIPTNITFTGPNVNTRVKGLDDGVMTPAVMGLPEATVVTAAPGCNNGVNSGSMFSTNLTQAQANFFRSVHLVTMTSGALEHSSAQITGYTFTGSVGCLTVTPAFPVAPSIGDTLTIVNR